MQDTHLAQAPVRFPEVVGQRTIITESDYNQQVAGSSEPILSTNFIYMIAAIGLLIVAAWAIQQYSKRSTLRAPVEVVPIKKKPKQ